MLMVSNSLHHASCLPLCTFHSRGGMNQPLVSGKRARRPQGLRAAEWSGNTAYKRMKAAPAEAGGQPRSANRKVLMDRPPGTPPCVAACSGSAGGKWILNFFFPLWASRLTREGSAESDGVLDFILSFLIRTAELEGAERHCCGSERPNAHRAAKATCQVQILCSYFQWRLSTCRHAWQIYFREVPIAFTGNEQFCPQRIWKALCFHCS